MHSVPGPVASLEVRVASATAGSSLGCLLGPSLRHVVSENRAYRHARASQRGLWVSEAARESLKEALRVRPRPSELRNLAWVARSHTYLAEGKKAMARKDYEKVLADDASYPGLQELLAAFTT